MFVSVRTLAATGLRSALPVVLSVVAVAAFCLYGACGCASKVGDLAEPADDELGADALDLPDPPDAADETSAVLLPDALPDAPTDLPTDPDAVSRPDTSSAPDTRVDAPVDPTDTAPTDTRDATVASDTSSAPDAACPTHHNGSPAPIGQTYDYCAPLGVPGNASTYSLAMATAAAGAWSESGTVTTGPCAATSNCLSKAGATKCVTWCYSGALAGRVYVAAACWCPLPTDPTWN